MKGINFEGTGGENTIQVATWHRRVNYQQIHTKMKVASAFSAVSFLAALAVSNAQSTGTETVTYNPIYDNGSLNLSTTACAQWAKDNNFKTLSDVPNFPYIGASSIVANGNVANCGQCSSITDPETDETIFVTVVDAAGTGYVLSFAALNNVTDGQGANLGSFQGIIDGVFVSSESCSA